jgi:hypothetical protein
VTAAWMATVRSASRRPAAMEFSTREFRGVGRKQGRKGPREAAKV